MRSNRNSGLNIGAVMLGAVVLAALLAPTVGKHGPTEQPFRELALAGPSVEHWLGVDGAGRDVLTRMLFGARVTLGIALGATAIAIGLGVLLGAAAGTLRGFLDAVVSHVTDFLLAFPSILLGLVALTILRPSPTSVAIAVGIASLPTVVRQVRAAFVSESGKDYVLAARAAGAGRSRIAAREILPNCVALILVLTTLTLGSAVLESAGLAFLGLSGQPDVAEWGMMLREERSAFRVAPWLCIAPGVAIAWTVLALNLISDGLQARRRSSQ
jgi:ABC-type dipeptide/oligopeptide/nickel transport system permease subunit